MTVGLLHGSKTNARENFLFSRLFKTSKFDLDQKYICCFYWWVFLTDSLIELSRTVRNWRPVKKKCFHEKWWWNRNKRTTTSSSSSSSSSSTVHGNAKRVRQWLDLRAGGPRGVDTTCNNILNCYWIYRKMRHINIGVKAHKTLLHICSA